MALKPGGPPLPGDGSGDRHMPGGRRPLGPANGGVTEDWGKVILRIKEDLSSEIVCLFVCLFGTSAHSDHCVPY